MNIHTIKLKPLIYNLLAVSATALLSFLLSGNFDDTYNSLRKPFLAPPQIVFPIVWSILFLLMAAAAYLVSTSDSADKKNALIFYGLQLFFNFTWTVIFFRFQLLLMAFVWLCALVVLVFITAVKFYIIKNISGYLLVPYLLWLLFAGYLNAGFYLLN